ncbi:hypothetical protein FA13DRAFT_334693 [Coprinellus micaceus]|uniref:Hydrophobin n=1 Tax=Coprinellus micaceus TaxID=71717 RepID=A0A4Y7TDH4_COPMI|nr:hypothetical protein FA13DRAFT_334693 [Coprinellus micaceus]
MPTDLLADSRLFPPTRRSAARRQQPSGSSEPEVRTCSTPVQCCDSTGPASDLDLASLVNDPKTIVASGCVDAHIYPDGTKSKTN